MVGSTGIRAERSTRTVPAWSLVAPFVVVLVAVAVGVGIVMVDSSPKQPWVGPGTAAIGSTAPDFSTWDLNGNAVRLSSLKGTPVLLTFWSTSCTACQQEFPALQRIQAEFQATGFTVLAVDYRETDTGHMQRFLDGLHVKFRAVIDPQGAIAWAYGVDIGLPVNVWLDRSQTVADFMLGEKPSTDLLAAAAKITS